MQVKLLSGVCLGKDPAGNVIDGEPEKVYDVPAWLAKNLHHRGKAEINEAKGDDEKDPDGSDEKPLDAMKAGEIVKYAEANNLDIGGLQPQAGKEKVLAAVLAAIEKKKEAE
jgi:hypothetical protein